MLQLVTNLGCISGYLVLTHFVHNIMFSAGNKELPPRFKNKIMLAQQQGQGNLEDVSLRPAPMSMMFKPTNTKPVLLNPGMLAYGCFNS
jgi:hypothetical protein